MSINNATKPPRRWPGVIVAALVFVVIVVLYQTWLHRYLSFPYIRDHVGYWQEWVGEHFVLALLIYFALYVSITALSLPGAAPMTMVGGALFGRWVGSGVVSVAATLGATLAFLGSRYLLRDWVQARMDQRLHTLNEGIQREGPFYLFSLRLIPVVPFFLVNIGMGLTPIRLVPYILVSWLGMLPGTFLYANAGTELAAVHSPSDLISSGLLIAFALLGLMPLLLRKALNWYWSGGKPTQP